MKRLQDIADQVGVSRTTVSNVLHGNTKKVSKEMIRKISEILNQEGYVPNTSSRELTRKVLHHWTGAGLQLCPRHPFSARYLCGRTSVWCRRDSPSKRILCHADQWPGQKYGPGGRDCSRWNVDGLVVLGLDEKKYKELRRQLNKYMVLIDTYPEAEYHYVNVGTDDFGGGA